jgi:hypothetical protein
MIRTVERIQEDIVQTTLEIQALRRTQGPLRDNELSSVKQRIQQLTLRLDALYAEKRAAGSPASSGNLRDAEGQQADKAVNRLIAELFRI